MYNIAPSVLIPVVRSANDTRELVHLRWGLVPHWNKRPKPTPLANARTEIAPEMPDDRLPPSGSARTRTYKGDSSRRWEGD
jgi:putative SOS response-associated peptidase YedK